MQPPAFPMGKERVERCVKRLKEIGYRVKTARVLEEGKNFHGYLAGNGKERAADLNEMFADPEINGIICLSGAATAAPR